MPKRVLKHHLAQAVKIRRKSEFLDDPSQLLENPESENSTEVCDPAARKHMHYIPSNRNNEVERLLMYNSKSLIYRVDHSDFPAFNVGMWPQENCDLLSYYPTCAFSAPHPLFIANKPCEKIDICFKRPMNRYFFRSRMRTTRTAYQTALKSNKNIRSSIKDSIYHYSVFEMAERVYMQPDPYFQSSYDFYFTGGNLTVLPAGNIVHAGGKDLREMSVSGFPVAAEEQTDTNILRNIATLKNSENCEVFEFHPLLISHTDRSEKCFVARQRNLITFNYLNDTTHKIKTVTKFQTKSTPFISFAQSERDINKFIITTMKQHIRLYDLGGNAPALIKLFEISSDENKVSWNTVKPWRENTFLFANEKQFFMIDIRTQPEQWLKEVSFASNDLICEHISAVLPSDFNNLFYIATNHKLQCMDIRYLKKSSLSDSSGGVSRWTHQLRYAPLMMDTFRLQHEEYIALSSPLAGDLHICQLSRDRNEDGICLDASLPKPKHIYTSPCLPYQPPTLLEAYENARLSGKCLKAGADLKARIKCCTTGMKFYKPPTRPFNSGIGLLLIANSNGDVFASSLSKREEKDTEERCNKQSDELMTQLEHKIYNGIPQPLNYTEIKNMKGLRKVFLCKSLSSIKNIDFDKMPNEFNGEAEAVHNTTKVPGKPNPKRLHLGRWQKSLSTLHSYKDALVVDLLSIWDIDIEEEHKIHLGSLRHDVKTDPAVKVENWLQQNINTDPAVPSQSISVSETIRHSDNKVSNVGETSFNINQTQNTVDFENAIHSTQILHDTANLSGHLDTTYFSTQVSDGGKATIVEKLKNKKKTKKYVKGF